MKLLGIKPNPRLDTPATLGGANGLPPFRRCRAIWAKLKGALTDAL